MVCPKCEKCKTRVIETRSVEEGVFRKRECPKCGHVIYTEEYESDDREGINYVRRMLKRNQRARRKL